jgi:hypothetical protein
MIAAAALLLAAAYIPPEARPVGQCLDIRPGKRLGFAGRLRLRTFPGRPNYESIAKGDAAAR